MVDVEARLEAMQARIVELEDWRRNIVTLLALAAGALEPVIEDLDDRTCSPMSASATARERDPSHRAEPT